MGKYIPVEPEKWAAMVQAQSEVTRLKAEVERLRKAGDGLYGIAYNAGPGEGRVEKLDVWRAAKEGKPSV